MKKQLIPFLVILSISGCTSNIIASNKDAVENEHSIDEPKAEVPATLTVYDPSVRYSQLLWVEKANPVNDALQAIKKGDTTLWGYKTRSGPKIPGVDDKAVATILQSYEIRVAPAMGDTVHGSKHLELQLKFIKYAEKYNTEILK